VLAVRQGEEIKALKKSRFEADQGKTHWEGCWREHYRCAMDKIEELLKERKGEG
jgi:hypothetical protein